MPTPEEDLARFAHSGCEDAFRNVIDHYGSLVLNTARRRVRDAGLAEELAQNVFVLLARKAGKVSRYRSVSAWLFETTRLEAAKLLRGQVRHQRRIEAFTLESQEMDMTDDHELRNLLPNLEEALDSLKAAERKILLSRFFDEQSFREIASSTGKTESACKMALSRTLEKLRRKLQAQGISVTVIALGTFLQIEWAKSAPVATLSSLSGKVIKAASGGAAISKPVMMISPYKILLFSVVALLIGVCFTWVPNQELPQRQEPLGEDGNGEEYRARRTINFSSSQRGPRESVEREKVNSHEVKDLPDFYLPEITLENTNLEEAMAVLVERYQLVCRETGEEPLPIAWELEGQARTVKKLGLGNSDLVSSCRLIALLSGTSLEIDGNLFRFKEIMDGPRISRQWNVPPTFPYHVKNLVSNWVELPPEVFEYVELENVVLPDDLPVSPGQRVLEKTVVSPNVEDLLRSAGFLGEEESLQYFPGSGRLVVEAGIRHASLIDAVVMYSSESMPIQFRYRLKNSVNGVEKKLPAVVARPGQTATVELGKEYIEREFQDGEPVVAWVGVRLFLEPELYGFSDRTRVNYFYTGEPTEENVAKFHQSGRLDDLELVEFKIEDQLVLHSFERRRQDLPEEFVGTDREGNQLGLSFLSERIDATGRRLTSRKLQKTE